MWCFGEKNSAAQKRYLRRGLGVLVAYVLLLSSATVIVQRVHPHGVLLYCVAFLPLLPMLSFLVVVGRYLREERDEYQRDLVIRCMLWGIAAMLSVELFDGFLHSFGWHGALPPFVGFYAFCLSMLIAKFTYKFRDRVDAAAE